MKLVVLGGGESGVGTAILGKQKGYDVFVSDFGIIKDSYKKVLEEHEIPWEDQQHTESKILEADLIMKSPGISDKVSIVQKAKAKSISIISEIEFAAPHTKATLIGITGSNGKTTTTMLTYHLLKSGGLNVGVAGNIGQSFAWQVATQNYDVYVLELSSFQLDGIETFKPHIAVITNISPDHLDRYDYKYENYIASKFRITMNQNQNDYLIYDGEDAEIKNWLSTHTIKAVALPFSFETETAQGAFEHNNTITVKTINEEFTMSTNLLSIQGKHNVKNAMAATTIAQLMRIRKQTIRESLTSFQGVEHRLEKVVKINEVQYINDSKATNVNATFFALDSMEGPTVWIVGGVDKGNDYMDLMPLVREKVKAIVCLGVDNSKIINAFKDVIDVIVETSSMKEAVAMSYQLSEKGDAVLLSPCCASFDLFENYEDRGRQFKREAHNL